MPNCRLSVRYKHTYPCACTHGTGNSDRSDWRNCVCALCVCAQVPGMFAQDEKDRVAADIREWVVKQVRPRVAGVGFGVQEVSGHHASKLPFSAPLLTR